MAVQDWDNPVLASAYADFLSIMKGRDVDASTMVVMTNPPDNAKVWDTGDKTFKNFDNPAWTDLVLAVAGGGTGSTTAAGARTNLGLGTMAIQNAAAVAITGGTALFGSITTVDDTLTLGTLAAQLNKAYFKSGLKIPVGANAYLVA